MKILLPFIGKLISIAVTLVVLGILVMPVYFAIRSTFPLDRPEFHGQTVWQVMDQRATKATENARKYQVSHPGRPAKPEACYVSERVGMVTMLAPMAMACGVMDATPDLSQLNLGSEAKRASCGQIQANWFTAPAAAWQTYENLIANMFRAELQAPVPFCRIGL